MPVLASTKTSSDVPKCNLLPDSTGVTRAPGRRHGGPAGRPGGPGGEVGRARRGGPRTPSALVRVRRGTGRGWKSPQVLCSGVRASIGRGPATDRPCARERFAQGAHPPRTVRMLALCCIHWMSGGSTITSKGSTTTSRGSTTARMDNNIISNAGSTMINYTGPPAPRETN